MFNHLGRTSFVMAMGWFSVMALIGCQMQPDSRASKDWFAEWKKDSAPAKSDPVTERAERKAQEHAQRLAQAMNKPPAAEPSASNPESPTIRWITPGTLTSEAAASETGNAGSPSPTSTSRKDNSGRLTGRDQASDHEPNGNTGRQSLVPKADQSSQTRIQDLRQAIRAGADSANAKAINLIALSLLSKENKLTEADLAALDPQVRPLAQQYHQAVQSLMKPLGEGQALRVSPQALSQFLAKGETTTVPAPQSTNSTVGDSAQPMQIRTVQLCKRVRGFGVYEPLDSLTLVSARSHRMIVYTEVDHFTVRKSTGPLGSDSYQVKLQQEVSLFNEADGLEVWRQPRVDIVDESRNQRRDFFLVQMIDLPARLGVGKYRLNVRVIDAQGQSRDEKIVPLQVVADQSLVSGAPGSKVDE